MKIAALQLSPGHNYFGHHGRPPTRRSSDLRPPSIVSPAAVYAVIAFSTISLPTLAKSPSSPRKSIKRYSPPSNYRHAPPPPIAAM